MEFAGGRKRWRSDSPLNGNDGGKKFKQGLCRGFYFSVFRN